MSSALLVDEIFIRAGIRALYRSKYHCEKELEVLNKRIKDPNISQSHADILKEKFALRSKVKGCGYVIKSTVDTISCFVFNTCLCKFNIPIISDFIYMQNQFKNGILPFTGGLLDQPSKLIEILRITEDAMNQEENEFKKKESRNQGKVN